MFLLKPCITVHKFDVICLSQRYLDFSTCPDDDDLEITNYAMAIADHPTNTKQGRILSSLKHVYRYGFSI